MADTVSDHLLERLREWDVHRIYGYTRNGINCLLGALDRATLKGRAMNEAKPLLEFLPCHPTSLWSRKSILPKLMFPVAAKDSWLPDKARILGVEVGGESKAYPVPDPNPARGVWEDVVGGQTL